MVRTIEADYEFERYFQNIIQLFFYITDECNLRCKQCYYNSWLKKGHIEMETDILLSLLQNFREKGAIKLSLLGGEPTLYGQMPGNKPLSYVVAKARELGYKYIRLVTNGLFDKDFLYNQDIKLLDEISFSIDGDSPEIHNSLRGKGSFIKTLRNLQDAIKLGYNVHITMCVHRGNIGKDEHGNYLLDRAIHWAEGLGVNLINFHPIFKLGSPSDAWTGETDIPPSEWLSLYKEIKKKVNQGDYNIDVRIPMRFIHPNAFELQAKKYGFCSVKLGERVEVHPNGQIHSCTLHSGTSICLAKYSRDGDIIKVRWERDENELKAYGFDFTTNHPCVAMQKDFGEYVPLCISFKPGQNELTWNTMGLE